MRGLFLKIFAIFWIAQSLIFVISTALILRNRRPSPQILFETLSGTLQDEAKESIVAYETRGCSAFQSYAAAHRENLTLENAHGQTLCGAPVQVQWGRGDNRQSGDQIVGAQFGPQYVWRVPVVSADGTRYIFLLSRTYIPDDHPWYVDLLHFAFPQLLVAIAVGRSNHLCIGASIHPSPGAA